jgi:hypothetical protein
MDAGVVVGPQWSVDAAPPAYPANPTAAGRRAWSSLPLRVSSLADRLAYLSTSVLLVVLSLLI